MYQTPIYLQLSYFRILKGSLSEPSKQPTTVIIYDSYNYVDKIVL